MQLYISGPSPESLNLQTDFSYKWLSCNIRVLGNDPLCLDESPAEKCYFRTGQALELTISDESCEHDLEGLIERQDYEKISKLLRSVANICIRAIRYFGMVPHMQEIRGGKDEDYAALLKNQSIASQP